MPRSGIVLILDVRGVTGDVLLGGDPLGCGERGGPAGKRLREDIVVLVCPAAIMGDDPVVYSCHGFCSAVMLPGSKIWHSRAHTGSSAALHLVQHRAQGGPDPRPVRRRVQRPRPRSPPRTPAPPPVKD